MRDRNVQILNGVTSVVRCVVLLTATVMTRVQAYPAEPNLGLDLFLAFGCVYVLATALIDRYLPRYRPETMALVSLDVFYVTGLVWQTGGMHSEYYLLYYLPILNASLRLDFRQAIMSSALAALCYTLVMVAGGLESTVVNSAALQLATFGGSALVLALFFGTMSALSGSQRELTEKLQRAVERLSALYRVARAVHAGDSLQSVVDTTLELALELSGGRVGYLALQNGGGELLVKASRAAAGAHKGLQETNFDRHLAHHCLVQRALVVTDVRGRYADCGSHPDLPCGSTDCCVVSAPLIYGDHAYGALQLFARPGDTYGEQELEVVTALAQEASVAIENARLLTEVHRLSVTDELTGLYHRAEFRRLLISEVETARVNGDAIGVLLFDIDGMRSINSEHGHEAGDAVLLAFADLLRRYVRSQDMAARYGGDEFAVLLPRGGIDAARKVSVRLCHAMGQRAFQFEGLLKDEAHRFTLCAGAVVASEMPNHADQLIGRADEALFEAKQAGPGQIRFWEATVQRGIVTQVRKIVEQVQHSNGEQWR
jgi:diguanylate cyclase (GGDEF)-like protein